MQATSNINEEKHISQPEPENLDVKYELEDILGEGEWFRNFDENFLPIKLQKLDDSYHYILQKLTRKCRNALKYYHLCERYTEQINHETTEIKRLSEEIKNLEGMFKNHEDIALYAAQFVEKYDKKLLEPLFTLKDGPNDLSLGLKAFLCLGPKGTQGAADAEWQVIRELLKDTKKLGQMMRDLFTERVKDVSKAEVEASENFLRHFMGECSGDEEGNDNRPLARVIAFYVYCCHGCWDLYEAIDARKELITIKEEKLETLQKEIASYKVISKGFEEDVDEMLGKYKNAKAQLDSVEKDTKEADRLMSNFRDHCVQIEVERSKEKRDTQKMDKILKNLEVDCKKFEDVRIKVSHDLGNVGSA